MNKKQLRQEIDSFQTTQVAKEYENINFTIILNQPEHGGNIGSIARVMKNFNFDHLIILNPIERVEKILSYETLGYAMHGKNILLKAEIIKVENQQEHMIKFKEIMKRFDLIIATTAKGKHYRNIRRLTIFPENLTIPISQKPMNIAILFGKESRGLTNEEIENVDILLRIPTGDDYPSLNLSHACGIILYEIFKRIHMVNLGRGVNPVLLADKEDKKILYEIIKRLINKLKIRTHKKDNVFFAFKNAFERTLLSKKELSLITGVFSKVDHILKNSDPY